MKCVSVFQPWASLLVGGGRRYETRGWAPAHRGVLGIHASRKFPYDWQLRCEREPVKSALRALGFASRLDLPRGVLLGTVELVDVIPADRVNLEEGEQAFGDFRPGRYAWKVANPTPLAIPLRMGGRLGIYEVALDLLRSGQAAGVS
jgi:hypothetical protein